MSKHFSNEAQQAGELHSHICHDLLARTVSRLSPDLLTELNKSAEEFMQLNQQTTCESTQALNDVVQEVVKGLATSITQTDNLKAKKESNDGK